VQCKCMQKFCEEICSSERDSMAAWIPRGFSW
jgi:hypothetical protein